MASLVALTFLAFWAQYDANIEQRRQFNQALENERTAHANEKVRLELERTRQDEEFSARQKEFSETQKLQQKQIASQELQARINLFETRFYTMLSIHRDNATNIEVNKIKGRKVFMHMLDELKLIYQVFDSFYDENEEKYSDLSLDEVYNIAYLSFFFGIGEKSTPMVIDLLTPSQENFTIAVHKLIKNEIDNARIASKDPPLRKSFIEINVNGITYKWDKVYSLGVGHLRRLSHYVRHLYQMVKFVDEQPADFMSFEQKYEYVTNIRAQLSVHEQLLLYYNALSILGQPWMKRVRAEENLLERYCILKSMPMNAADFYKMPEQVLPSLNRAGKAMFEWTEIQERMIELADSRLA
ncbi:MAG: hypothetical protein EOP48_23385 [Sphingobacteriales bacterium]|nr:MAG: hypothetical protein EOP48_23385 [Sphingobacteriales bacterium]